MKTIVLVILLVIWKYYSPLCQSKQKKGILTNLINSYVCL